MLDDYWEEKDTPYSDDSGLWTNGMYKYFNELPLYEAIERAYLTWKSEQHRLTPKYGIMRL